MKKVYSALFASCLLFTSCSSDMVEQSGIAYGGKFSISVTVPVPEDMRTRAAMQFSDGSTVNNLKCYVYSSGQGNGTAPIMVQDVDIVDRDGGRGGSISLDLPSGGSYDFVLLVTATDQSDTASKLYYDATSRNLNVNYGKIKSSDEDVDCFYGVIKGASLATQSNYNVTLRRPFAQLNIGTKDLSAYNSLSSSPLKSVGVSVDGVYSSMNVMDGNVVGDPVNAVFGPAALPSGQVFPLPGVDYLAMNYLLVNERKNVDVFITSVNDQYSFVNTVRDIPVQRNYQTNVYGKLLTTENDFHVDIDPMYVNQNVVVEDNP